MLNIIDAHHILLFKVGEHIGFGLSVFPSICPSVQKKFQARVLKFYIWIPR